MPKFKYIYEHGSGYEKNIEAADPRQAYELYLKQVELYNYRVFVRKGILGHGNFFDDHVKKADLETKKTDLDQKKFIEDQSGLSIQKIALFLVGGCLALGWRFGVLGSGRGQSHQGSQRQDEQRAGRHVLHPSPNSTPRPVLLPSGQSLGRGADARWAGGFLDRGGGGVVRDGRQLG